MRSCPVLSQGDALQDRSRAYHPAFSLADGGVILRYTCRTLLIPAKEYI